MTTLLTITDWLFFLVLGLPTLYLFIFATGSLRQRKEQYPPARKKHRFITLIPAYKGDAVVLQTAKAALDQVYPAELHQVVVIADHLMPETIAQLQQLPLRVIEVQFEQSSKAKAMTFAIETLGPEAADVVTILDVDNLVGPEFIVRINNAYDSGIRAVQAHRTAHNRDTPTAILDAASEEINNSIFRRGHVALGFSSALIGSGMAFDYGWFCKNIVRCTTAGEDKELEALLLQQGVYIDFLDDVLVFDEKVRGEGAYYNQRRRWLAAQLYALKSAISHLPGAIIAGNPDYVDKLIQWCIPPRILLVGLIPFFTLLTTIFDPLASIKWWLSLLLLIFALAIALPDNQTDERLGNALRKIPLLFLLTAANLFRIRGATHTFIHTDHSGTKPEEQKPAQ